MKKYIFEWRRKKIYIWVHRKYLWSIEARSNFSHFNGKTWDISSKLWQRLAIVNFSFILHLSTTSSISLSYLHFFADIDFIQQEQKYFCFCARQILILTFSHLTQPFYVHREFFFIPNFPPFLYFMLRPSHCNGLIDNTYISILNCPFSPISLQNGWISTFVLWCQMLASQIGCLKIFITFFPTRPHWMKNPPRPSEPEGDMLEHFIFMFLPQQSSAFFKTFTSFVKYFHGWRQGGEGEVVFRNSSYSQLFLFFRIRQSIQYNFVKSVFLRNFISSSH